MATCGSCGCCTPCDCDPCGASTGCGFAPPSTDENEILEEGSTPIGPDTRTISSVGHPGYYAGQHPKYFDYGYGDGASSATGGRAVDASNLRGSGVNAINGKHVDGGDDDESLSDEEIEIEFGRAQDSSSGPRKAHTSALGGRSKRSGNSCCAWWWLVCCCLIILAIIAAAIATPLILRNKEQASAAPSEEENKNGVGVGGVVGDGDGSSGAAAATDFDLEQYTKDVYDTLQPVSGSSVFDEGSPQNLAAEWILADAANYADGEEGAPVPRDVNDPRFLQRYALGVSHHALGGDEWSMCDSVQDDDEGDECTEDGKTTRWLSAGDECNWYGITCNSSGMIAKMDLGDSAGSSGLGLNGEIPQEIGEISTLRSLDLGNNGNVGGTIPESLSKTSLEQIDLANNQIESPFPESMYGKKQLQKIDIQNNNLDGPLPDFGAIPNLVYVDASGNDFSGTIPTTVGSLARLRMIDLGRNELSGPLPGELGQADRLERIIVNHNHLEGTISSDIASLPRLTQLNVRSNKLDGQVPESIGEMGNYWAENGTRRKKTILLDGNELEGDLPETIGSIDGLNVLSLQGNNFNADQLLPQTICDLETSSADDAFNLDKIFSDCEQVDCRCSEACQCIDGSAIGTVQEIITQQGPFDYDGDGLVEESTAGTNPFSPDSDGDGASDKEELDAGTNPLDPTDTPPFEDSNNNGVSDEVEAALLADSDGDGLTDEVEKILGLNPYSPDSDNDGASDSHEIVAGTNPMINEELIDEDETDAAFVALAKVSGNAVYVNDSPQNKAAKFVALNDPSGPRDPSNPYFLQRYALATFYYSTEGGEWEECHQNDKDSCDINGSRNAFLSNKHECQWAGVVCHNNGKVATIDFGLDGNGLSGDIPPEVGLLDELVRVNVPNNAITSIPDEIADTQITEINVSTNQIKAFPSTLEGKDSLERVHIDHNAFENQSLPNFSSMPNLNHLYANNNGFTGTIDPKLGSLDQLRNVDLSNNGLTGKIPSELGQLDKLVRLDLSNNQLTGELSPEVVSMPRLITLSASDNMLSGPIPAEIEGMGSYWSEKDSPRNKAIRLDENVLDGPIPEEIAAIKDLKDLALHGAGNKFSGEIPQAVCDMSLDELSSYCANLDCSCSDACVCVDDLSVHNMIDNDAVSLDSAIIDGNKEIADDGSDATDEALSLDSSATISGIAVVEGGDDQDSDGDGLVDAAEETLGLNPYNPDTDGDGASDKEELNAGTDPKDAQSKPKDLVDANDDGLSDSLTAALIMDSDGDGIIDSVEADDGTDPFSVDSDGDGASDSEEKGAGTDPLDPTDTPAFVKKEKNIVNGAVLDANNDGQSDAVEAAKALDSDGDGIVDIVEAYDGTDPTAKDTDRDSFSDSEEKSAGSNPNDPSSTPLSPDSSATISGIAVVEGGDDRDSDGDGLVDAAEETLGLNPYNPDTDGDGASDKEELNAGTDPKDAQSKPKDLVDANDDGLSDSLTAALIMDSDGDGIIDSVEADDGTDPFSVDSDGDGASDSEEKGAGTDPLDPTDTPAFVKKEKNIVNGAVLDANNDGQSDAVEAAKALDSDGDGIVDIVEAYDGTDPTAKDTDRDSFSDSEEKSAGSNPNDPSSTPLSPDSSATISGIAVVEGGDDRDSDGDGLVDAAEETLGLNPYNPDTDGDGASDKEELNAGTDPKDAQSKPKDLVDANDDGLSDSLTAALIMDSDGDGIIDSVEADDGTDPFSVDSDGDGASDSEEKGAGTDPLDPTDTPAFVKKEKNIVNGAVLDANNDGQSDAVEAAKALDSDGDGIVDIVEAYDGTDPTAKDTDRDSFSDSEEKSAGSNPNDPSSTPLSIENGEGGEGVADADPSDLEEGNPSVYKVLKSVSGDSIEVYGTPQYTAARWIISSDPAGTRAGDDPRLVQRYVLATFYYATNKDNNWKRCYEDHEFCNPGEAFLSEADECEWSGVTCDEETLMITRLEMQSNSLQGFMPSELGSLGSLLLMDFSQNEIGSTIPSSLSETPIVELILSGNELVGPFPETLYNKESIEHVCIDRNNYEGAMPTWANMPSLRHIYAFDNNFVGTLDPAIGTLTEVRTIAFNNNKLEGTIPSTFTALNNLEVFEVASNNLQGEIPEGLLGLPRIRYLWLASNNFSGALSGSIGNLGSDWANEGTARGKYIRLEDNQFSGSIPSELGSIKDLYLLTLHDNSFEGEMPQEVCDLPVAGASVDQYGLFKLTSSCEEVDCSCSSACKCIDGGDTKDWQIQGRRI